jgi:hypothetical protein
MMSWVMSEATVMLLMLKVTKGLPAGGTAVKV